MNQIKKELNKLKCPIKKKNYHEIKYWETQFLAKKPIPSPVINKNNEILAFHNCFFAIQNTGLRKTWCTQI